MMAFAVSLAVFCLHLLNDGGPACPFGQRENLVFVRLADDGIRFPVASLTPRRPAGVDAFQGRHLPACLLYVVPALAPFPGEPKQIEFRITIDGRDTHGESLAGRFLIPLDD